MRAPSLALGLAAALLGCGGEDAPVLPEVAVEGGDPAPAPGRRGPPEELYGTDGELLEGREVVGGLRLPRGLTEVYSEERSHAYLTDVPLLKVQRYFGPRLITGQVDRLGDGAVFRRATARDAQGATVHLDVAVIPTHEGTRVDITELPPAPAQELPQAEIERRVREHMKRLD